MSDSNQFICKYCLAPLLNEFEKYHEAHTSCSKEFEKVQTKYSDFFDQLEHELLGYEIVLYIEPKLNLKILNMFSLAQVKGLQIKIDKISSGFTSSSKFVILMVHNADLIHVVCNQINSLPPNITIFSIVLAY